MDYSIYYEHSNKVVLTIYDFKTITIIFEGEHHQERLNDFIFNMLCKQGKIGY